MRFQSNHAADLLPRHEISSIAPHDEMIRANGESTTLIGMKVKLRNLADGRWSWVIVGADREVMVFGRDIVWANLKGRRQTKKVAARQLAGMDCSARGEDRPVHPLGQPFQRDRA